MIYALTLDETDKQLLLEDAGWFSVTFAFIIVILSIPDIHQDQTAIVRKGRCLADTGHIDHLQYIRDTYSNDVGRQKRRFSE